MFRGDFSSNALRMARRSKALTGLRFPSLLDFILQSSLLRDSFSVVTSVKLRITGKSDNDGRSIQM